MELLLEQCAAFTDDLLKLAVGYFKITFHFLLLTSYFSPLTSYRFTMNDSPMVT